MDDTKLSEEAAGWLLRLEDDASVECKTEFAAWLARSPLNMGQFLLVSAAYREIEGLDSQGAIDVDGQIAQMGAEVDLKTVNLNRRRFVPSAHGLSSAATSAIGRWSRRPRSGVYAGLAAAVALAAVAFFALHRFAFEPAQSYKTATGEQRAIKLNDDSVVQLNTRSHIEIHLSTRAREVRLLDGEALFAIEHDPKRPFRVITDAAVIQAIGTQFDVYRQERATTVSVVQGAVKVSTSTGGQLTLKGGEEARIVRNGRIIKNNGAEVARALAWQQRKLDFRGARLDEVAEQFNRYNRLQIHIEDPSAAARQLNGVFNADQPQALLDFLREDPNVKLEQSGDEIVIRERNDGSGAATPEGR